MTNRNYIFAGYCLAGCLADITPEQTKKLTHLNIAFGLIENGEITIEHAREDLEYYITKIRNYNPALNILLSTAGGDPVQGKRYGAATRTSEGMERIVSSTMKIVHEFSLDGIDCDWEYPGSTGDKNERFQHTVLMEAYRSALDRYAAERGRKCYLTLAAHCSHGYIENVNLSALADVLDFINLMCYDFRWSSPKTGHQCNTFTPLNDDDPISAQWAVDLYVEAGFPKEKLVLGAAFYSHRYDGVQGDGNGYGMIYKGRYTYGPNYTDLNLIHEKSSRFVKYWDDAAKEPWLFDGESFITYDDPMAMRYKCEYVKQAGLAGVMYWEHSCDKTSLLFNAIYDNLML